MMPRICCDRIGARARRCPRDLPVTAGGGLATRAAWTIARQVESGKLLERFPDGGGELGLNFSAFVHHCQPRRELGGEGQAPGPEGGDELLPGLDDLIERE
jgi:hypothetical protein